MKAEERGREPVRTVSTPSLYAAPTRREVGEEKTNRFQPLQRNKKQESEVSQFPRSPAAVQGEPRGEKKKKNSLPRPTTKIRVFGGELEPAPSSVGG